MNIEMTNLKLQYAHLKREIDDALFDILKCSDFILGPAVEKFEKAFAAYHGAKHCIGVSNGTDALVLVLRAMHIGEGHEVITSPHTCGTAIEAICEVGAQPVFVDIDDRYFTMDVNQIKENVTEKTRAIIPVHIYGHPVDMDAVMDIAAEYGLFVIEDAAQAHGARYKGRLAGAIGHAGCFSFYPDMNLGAYGDAGGIIVNDDKLAETLQMLRNQGHHFCNNKYYYQSLGFNRRMDDIQGAVLNVKLSHLDRWNDLRRRHAESYRALLQEAHGFQLPTEAPYARHVYHLFVVQAQDRDGLKESLKEAGIASAVQYPFPLHLTPAYAFLGYRQGDLPVYEKTCETILALPMYPELTDRQIAYISEKVEAFSREVLSGDRKKAASAITSAA